MDWMGKQVDVRDTRGTLVIAGDLIAAAFTSGNTPYLRIGRVLSYLEKLDYSKIASKLEVEWLFGSGYIPDKPTKIQCYTEANHSDVRDNPWIWNNFVRVELSDV